MNENVQITPTILDTGKHHRFHPSYYQSRKGSFISKDDPENRVPIRIQKLQKKQDCVSIYLAKKSGERINLSVNWHEIDFDYFEIKSNDWLIKLSKK